MARYDDKERRWREDDENRRRRERTSFGREDWRDQERDSEREGWRGQANDWMTYGREDFGRRGQRDWENPDYEQTNRMSGGEDLNYRRGQQDDWRTGRSQGQEYYDWEPRRGESTGREPGRTQQDYAGRGGRYDERDFDRTNRQDWDRSYDRGLHDYAGQGGRYNERDFDRGTRTGRDYGRAQQDYTGSTGRYQSRDFERTTRQDWDRGGDWDDDLNRSEAEHYRGEAVRRAPHQHSATSGRYQRRAFSGGVSNPYDEDYMYDYDEPVDWTYTEIWEIEGPFTGMGPQGYRRSDDRIFEDICERLTQHGQIDASDIEVEINDGDVTLKGSVDDRRSKRLAEDVAASVNGVSDVQNHLRVTEQNRSRYGRGQDRDYDYTRDRDRDRGTVSGMTTGMTGTHTGTTGTQTGRTTGTGRSSEMRNKIRQGMRVVGRDNEDIGEVKEIQGSEFLVDRPIARDVYVPIDACEDISNDRIKLNVDADKVNDQGWRNPDLLGDDNS
jgi:hypothetical protein